MICCQAGTVNESASHCVRPVAAFSVVTNPNFLAKHVMLLVSVWTDYNDSRIDAIAKTLLFSADRDFRRVLINFSKRRGVNKKVADDAQKRNDIALTPLAINITVPFTNI